MPAWPRGRSLIAAKMARAWLDSRLGRRGQAVLCRAEMGLVGPGRAGLGVGSDPTAASGESRGEEAADAEVEQAARHDCRISTHPHIRAFKAHCVRACRECIGLYQLLCIYRRLCQRTLICIQGTGP